MAHRVDAAPGDQGEEHGHPGERTYVKIALFLAAITLIEVAIYYFDMPRGLLVTLLIAFSLVKFYTVVSFFMHLKFDDRRLAYIFVGGLLLSAAVFIALDVMQRNHPLDYALREFTSVQDETEPS